MRAPSLLTLGALALTALAGCREDSQSPVAPSAESAPLAASSATSPVFRQVSSGGSHNCGVTTDDRVYCWGFNNTGQLGTGTVGGEPVLSPVAVASPYRFRSVSVRGGFTCAVTLFDAVFCWGQNNYGQLGNGTTVDSPRPVRIATRVRIREVSAGTHHACAASIGDIVYCWGRNELGEIGDGTKIDRRVPTRPLGWSHFSSVSAGDGFSCGVTTINDVTPPDRAYCWGAAIKAYGSAGPRFTVLRPTAVPGGVTFARVASGDSHVCGVTASHRAFCWGANRDYLGSVSPGDFLFQTSPRLVAGGHQFRSVSAGSAWSCGVTTDDVGYCWGDHGALGVGNGAPEGSPTPVRVGGDLHFREISAGGDFTCGITTGGKAYCWGMVCFYGPTPVPADDTAHDLCPGFARQLAQPPASRRRITTGS